MKVYGNLELQSADHFDYLQSMKYINDDKSAGIVHDIQNHHGWEDVLEKCPGIPSVLNDRNRRRPGTIQRCVKKVRLIFGPPLVCFGAGVFVGIIFVGIILNHQRTDHLEPPPGTPSPARLQVVPYPFTNNSPSHSVDICPEDVDKLERLGVHFFLCASNSTCPPEICLRCALEVYKANPEIEPKKPCDKFNRTINESCFLCSNKSIEKCYNFNETLIMKDPCKPECGELTRMADLNNYCNEGHAIVDNSKRFSSSRDKLKCACPHGKTGDTCEKESEKGRVLCSCYKKRYKLLEKNIPAMQISKCENASFDSSTECYHSTMNCYCVFTEERAVLNSSVSCDDIDIEDSINNSGTTRETRYSEDAHMGKHINNAERNTKQDRVQSLVFALLVIAISGPT